MLHGHRFEPRVTPESSECLARRHIASLCRTEDYDMAHAVPLEAVQMEMQGHPSGVLLRTVVIGLTAFLTVVDLFATQAILPSLARAYNVTPAAMLRIPNIRLGSRVGRIHQMRGIVGASSRAAQTSSLRAPR